MSRILLCKLLISNSMVSREIWINMHSLVFQRPQIALVLRTRAILRSLKNSLVHVISELHSIPCHYLYMQSSSRSSCKYWVKHASCHFFQVITPQVISVQAPPKVTPGTVDVTLSFRNTQFCKRAPAKFVYTGIVIT